MAMGTQVADCSQLVADRDSLSSVMGEEWEARAERVRRESPHGHLPRWRLLSVMVKSRDDVRQEQFAVQLITLFSQIYKKSNLAVWLRPYQVLATGADAGLIEVVNNTLSLHGLKKKMLAAVHHRGRSKPPTLKQYFDERYGKDAGALQRAKTNFARSLAGYAVVCYIMQIKDRHNGNILIDNQGYLVHIDFGFMLSNSPGNINFEKAAFKLTREMVDVMGGEKGPLFAEFQRICVAFFLEVRAHARQIMMLVEITRAGQPDMPCFTSRAVLDELHQRFRLNMSKAQAGEYFVSLIREALDNWYTRQYDKFQRLSNGILE